MALLLAARELEHDRGPHGFSMREATDTANVGKFVGGPNPIVDLAEKARLDALDRYVKQHDRPDNPVNLNGLIFRVRKLD